jgi:hypothetical protein
MVEGSSDARRKQLVETAQFPQKFTAHYEVDFWVHGSAARYLDLVLPGNLPVRRWGENRTFD